MKDWLNEKLIHSFVCLFAWLSNKVFVLSPWAQIRDRNKPVLYFET